LAYCPNLGPMLRKCLPIKLYQYQSTTPFSLNQYKMVWIAPKPSSHIEYPRQSSRVNLYSQGRRGKSYKGIKQQSTGRTRVRTPTTVRNLNSSYMTNRVNGKGRTTSSTTGESRRQR
jgi:hypothetical protein